MIREPYETALLRGYPVKKITEQLEVEYIQGGLKAVEAEGDLAGAIVEVLPGTADVEILLAPKLLNSRDGERVAIDSRASKRMARDGSIAISSMTDYRFSVLHAALIYLWATTGPSLFSQLGQLPVKIYATWVGDGISRRLNLDPLNAARVKVLSAYFYMGQFIEEPLDDARKYGIASVMSRALAIPQDVVVETILHRAPAEDLNGLIEEMRNIEGAHRLSVLNSGLLYTSLAGGWYGANAKVTTLVALEYAPTFLAMVYSSFADRTFHGSYFAKTAQLQDRRDKGREVVLAIDHLIRGVQ